MPACCPLASSSSQTNKIRRPSSSMVFSWYNGMSSPSSPHTHGFCRCPGRRGWPPQLPMARGTMTPSSQRTTAPLCPIGICSLVCRTSLLTHSWQLSTGWQTYSRTPASHSAGARMSAGCDPVQPIPVHCAWCICEGALFRLLICFLFISALFNHRLPLCRG